MVQTFVKRPVSPLHYEPLESRPEDLLWPGSDDEADEGEREKKRVRVELLGKSYLEGKPLFIQSAGLVGPFENGWQNPWAKKRALHPVGVDDFSETFRAPSDIHHGRAESVIVPATAKRRSIADTGIGALRAKSVHEGAWEEPKAKRQRHEDAIPPLGYSVNESRPTSVNDSRDIFPGGWLRRNGTHAHPQATYQPGSPSPTPSARAPSKPLEISPVHHVHPATMNMPKSDNSFKQSRNADRSSTAGFTPVNKPPAMGRQANRSPFRLPLNSVHKDHVPPRAFESPRARAKHVHQPDASTEHKNTSKNAKHLLHEVPTSLSTFKERLFTTKTQYDQPPSPASSNTGKPMPSRLTPYVSDIVQQVSATSAKLQAVSKSPRPSPQAAPPSTNLPEFQYHYTKKGPKSSFSRWKVKRPETKGKLHIRPISISTSSSGSSDFAEAFEAAQVETASGSSMSFHASSPRSDRPETMSIKKNTQAMRRLTFTSSGEPKIAGKRDRSWPNSSSSLAEARNGVEAYFTKGNKSTHKTPTKSSGPSTINGIRSKDSEILPEAQLVQKAPIQLPSGPSTDLMETDEQVPKFVSLEEEDSYLDMSTQAAMLKVQRAFKDDVVSPDRAASGSFQEGENNIDKAIVTPRTNGHVKQAIEIKPEPEDEEPMSTQAIADAISPFVVTTVKKRPPLLEKRTSFAPSPTKNRSSPPVSTPYTDPSPTFQKPLSMATTPSNSQSKSAPKQRRSHPNTTSKPPSSLTSLSGLPNGTLTTETSILQDGQQPQQDFDVSLPPDPFFTPSAAANGIDHQQQQQENWVNEVLEEAESFLGDWNVETEAKKEGNSRRKQDGRPRGILSDHRGG